ncbi:MAG TPA: VWA domain-containing protein [Solirubrobacter sp.]|nr:VWA domain-containing protein [Solirubrobacter sp.]
MSFAEPILLAGFILIPLAMMAYGSLQRRRRRESSAWANPALVPNLTTAKPGWRRHLPPFLLLIALAVLVVALARPQRTVAAPQRAANVIMVTDISGSMNATDVSPDRLTAAVEAAKTLTEKVPQTFRLGLVTFSDYAEQRVAPTTDRAQIRGALDQLAAEGGTAMGDGLERGLFAARTPVPNANGTGVRRLPSVIVLLSDGKNTSGTRDPVQVAREAARARVPIYTIALGTAAGEVELRDSFGFLQRVQVPPDTETLKQVARISGGRFYTATETDKVKEIYANLGTRLSSRSEKREVTAFFAGGAVFLLLAASGLSLRWFGRLI